MNNNNLKSLENDEVPKHKRKKNKTIKKSDHKHNYVLKGLDVSFKFSALEGNDPTYFVYFTEECQVCFRVNKDLKWVKKSEYEKLLAALKNE